MIRPILRLGLAGGAVWLTGSFVAGCDSPTEPVTGAIEVTSSTTGEPVDADGYAIAVDQGQARPIAVNASLTIDQIPAGEHRVQLTGIAPHCALSGASSRAVSVTGAEVAQVSFQVQCSTPTGGIEITTQTTGESPDPDGYTIMLDGQGAQTIAASGTTTVTGVTAGIQHVSLTSIAANCAVTGERLRDLTVAGDTTGTTFEITCLAPTGTVMVRTTSTGNLSRC